MSEIPPGVPDTIPPTPPPVVVPSTRVWPYVILFLVFAFFTFQAIKSLGSPARSGEAVEGLDMKLKQVFFTEVMRPPTAGALTDKEKETKQKALREVIKEAEETQENAYAARVRLVAGHELKEKPSAKALAVLQKSDSPADRNFARIYDSDLLSREQAKMWSPQPDRFTNALARAHAYRKAGDSSIREDLISVATYLPLMIAMGVAAVSLVIGLACLIGLAVLSRRAVWPFTVLAMPDANEGDRMTVRAAIAMALQFGAALLAIPLGSLTDDRMTISFVIEVLWLVLVAVSLRWPIFGVSDAWGKLVNLRKNATAKSIFGVAGFFANLPILLVVVVIVTALMPYLPKPSHPATSELASGGVITIILTYLVAGILAPILEEVIFRGLLMRSLMGLFKKPWPAILLQGFLFAIIHPQGPALWLALMAIGSMCGWLAYRSGSLIPGMILHFLWNSALVIMAVATR